MQLPKDINEYSACRVPPNWPKGFFGRIRRSTGSMTRNRRSSDTLLRKPFPAQTPRDDGCGEALERSARAQQ